MVIYKQAAIAFMVATLLLAAVCFGQRSASLGPARPGMASISGTVVTLDGHPTENARVELRDALSGSSLQSAYTDPAGQFEMNNVAAGRYLVVASSGLERNDSTGARADMEEAVKDDPGFSMGYIVLGATYNSLSLFDDALRVLDRGVAMSPTRWQGYYEMVKACLGKGDFQTAVRQLNKPQQLAPEAFAPLHLVKAHALLGLKAYN